MKTRLINTTMSDLFDDDDGGGCVYINSVGIAIDCY